MAGYLATEQAAEITGMNPGTIGDLVRRGVITPARRGKRSTSHLFGCPAVLGLGAGAVLLRLGIRGQALHNAIRLVASHSDFDLQRVFESTPVLAVIPGAAVVAQLVSREYVQEEAATFLRELGAFPIGLDLELMYRKMLDCIAKHEANGWRVEPAPDPQERRIDGSLAEAESN